MSEKYHEQTFSNLELLIEFINNHNIEVINIAQNIYTETYREYVLLYSYMEAE